jgi:hypothetical protein
MEERQMMYQKFWGLLFLMAATSSLVGCGLKPHVDIYMEPVAKGEKAQINPQAGSITLEQKGVRITLEPLDGVKLFELTEDPSINPYLVSDGRNIDPLYTVFGVRVRNIDNKRVVIDETGFLIDAHGDQYASLPYGFFSRVYDTTGPRTAVYHDIGYRHSSPYPRSLYRSPYRHYFYGHLNRYRNRPPYRVYHTYPDPYHLNDARNVARDTVFKGGKLFQGAKRSGLLVFDRLDLEATDVSVIIPNVIIINGEESRSKVDFEFDFRQVVAVQE